MSKSTDLTSLGDRLKGYETQTETTLPMNDYLVVRLDGHKFSKFTKGLTKPFDTNFNLAMRKTVEILMKEFQAICGYTQSDEITLILPPRVVNDNNQQIYASRVQKIVSLTAGLCSSTFSELFTHPTNTSVSYFDSRVYSVPIVEEAYNSIMWRCRDANKNSKNVFAQTYCSHKSLLHKNSQEQIEFCLDTTGKDWDSIDADYKFGTFFYKTRVWVEADPKNPKAKPAWRNKITSSGLDLTYFDEDKLNMLLPDNKQKEN